MKREESCAKAGICDIAGSRHGVADVGMPVADGRGGRSARGLYEPGGAFLHRPAVLTGVHVPELCETIEMRERVRIAHRHNAVLTASSADPTCLFIKAPCKVTAPPRAMPCYL